MAAGNTLKLAFILSATDKMSRIVDQAVKKSTDKLSAFERTTSNIGRSMMKAGSVMVGVGAAVSSAMFGIAKSTANYGDAVWKTSQKVGMGVEDLQRIAYAAKYSDVEMSELTAGMTKFNKKIVEAASGSKTAGQMFNDLGIKLHDANGNLRKPNEIFEDLSNLFHNIEDGPAKTAAAMEAFGKSGANLIPLLNLGKDGLRNMGDEAVRTGWVMSESTAKACEEFNDNIARVKDGVKGVVFQFGNAFIPILDGLAKKLTETIGKVTMWIQDNHELIKTISKVTIWIGGLLIKFGGFITIVGGVAITTAKIVTVFRTLKAAIEAAGGALKLFNAICKANKAVLIMTAIAVAAYFIIKNWDSISAFFVKLWDDIKKIFNIAWNWIKNMFLNYTHYGLIIKHWNKVSGIFAKLWNRVKKIFNSTWEWIKSMFLNYHPIGILITHWDKVVDLFAGIWNNIKGVFSTGWQGISDFFTGLPAKMFEWGKNILIGLWNGITSMVNKVVDGVKNIGKKIAGGFKSFFGINSPSKLFAEYGVNLTQGLVVGMDRGGNAIENATGGMAAHATSGINRSMQSNTVNTSTVMNGGNAGVSLTYSPQITINGPVSQETKAEFSKMLQQHANDIIAIIQRDNENKTRLSFNA